jgi:carboxymethylenebutenolidase
MNKNIKIGDMPAYHSYPATDAQNKKGANKNPGLIIIHEIWGLDAHVKDVADRFAAQGYSVLAPNLFHNLPFDGKISNTLLDEMMDPATKDEAQKKIREVMAPISSPEYAQAALAELKACVDYLVADEHANGKIAVLGFCFGGTYAFHLVAQDSRITAAVPFYGQPPMPEEISKISVPVLAFYGDEDEHLMKSLPKLREDMKAQGKDFTAIVYPKAGHAFFNDTNKNRYRPEAAKDSWDKSLAFLKEHLG